MHKRLASRHSRPRVTLTAARSVRRMSVRSLRHHAARVDVLSRREAAPLGHQHADGSFRAWLRAVLSALRSGTRARRLLLRGLLRRSSARRASGADIARTLPGNRRPRRLSASAGWFAFAAR
jgi:hypothetical protein